MNARDALIQTVSGSIEGQYLMCRICGVPKFKEDSSHPHKEGCPVPALLAQFEAMQKVCEAATELHSVGCVKDRDRLLWNALAELDKLNQKDT